VAKFRCGARGPAAATAAVRPSDTTWPTAPNSPHVAGSPRTEAISSGRSEHYRFGPTRLGQHAIADSLEGRRGYEGLHDLVEYVVNRLRPDSLEDPAWETFECIVDGPEAVAWLEKNRPDVAARIPSQSRGRPRQSRFKGDTEKVVGDRPAAGTHRAGRRERSVLGCRFPTDSGRPKSGGSRFRIEWPKFGAPRPMNMGTIASLWRNDAMASCALQSAGPRWPSILHYAAGQL